MVYGFEALREFHVELLPSTGTIGRRATTLLEISGIIERLGFLAPCQGEDGCDATHGGESRSNQGWPADDSTLGPS